MKRAAEALLGDRRPVDRRELLLDLLGHRVVCGRSRRRVGGGLGKLLGERRRGRRVEGVRGHTAGERGRHGLQGEHRNHGRQWDRE